MDIPNKMKQFVGKLIENNILVIEKGVTLHPFFQPSTNSELINFDKNIVIDKKYQKFINNNFNSLAFKIIYNFVNPNKEILIEGYTFFSLDEIINRSKNYPNFIDIGLCSHGMGYVKVIAYYPSKNKFFFRMDGGSNGWDREGYSQFYNRLEYIPEDKSLFNIVDFFDVINRDINIENIHDFTPVYTFRET